MQELAERIGHNEVGRFNLTSTYIAARAFLRLYLILFRKFKLQNRANGKRRNCLIYDKKYLMDQLRVFFYRGKFRSQNLFQLINKFGGRQNIFRVDHKLMRKNLY